MNPSMPLIQNITLTIADTEYSLAIPAHTTRILIQARTAAAIRTAWETGKVAGSVAPYMTVKQNTSYTNNPLDTAASLTLYLASSTAGTVVEVETWA